MPIEIEKLRGWTPVRIELACGVPRVIWQDLRTIELTEPFLAQTLKRIQSKGDPAEVSTGIEELLWLDSKLDSLEPAGFIFHMSRCGSTLVSNAVRMLEDTIVMVESRALAVVINMFFGTPGDAGAHDKFRRFLLRAVVRSLGQRIVGTERRYFIKFGSAEVLQIEHIRRLWPLVPWVFVIRDPVEVIVSNINNSASWLEIESRPDQKAIVLGVDEGQIREMPREEYCARMVGKTCSTAVRFASTNSLFVDHKQLSPEMLLRIVRFLGVEPSSSESDRIREVATFYSKDPEKRQYVPDSEAKRLEASQLIISSAQQWAMESYSQALAIARRQAREGGYEDSFVKTVRDTEPIQTASM